VAEEQNGRLGAGRADGEAGRCVDWTLETERARSYANTQLRATLSGCRARSCRYAASVTISLPITGHDTRHARENRTARPNRQFVRRTSRRAALTVQSVRSTQNSFFRGRHAR
jgi:hypothetical protein